MDGDEPTQATQNVLDPRRVGKQNSGFSDEDISDILCVLYPHSDSARLELERLAREDCPHIISMHEADGVEPDYGVEDHASRFESNLARHGDYAIILRLSAQIKNPAAGFAFGRNNARCDVVFVNDPLKRVSNIHFRIYVNEFGNVMIEDQSTNGTSVDRQLLTAHPKDGTRNPVSKYVLESGNTIRVLLHKEINDLSFRVRIPRRDDEYDRAYTEKVADFFTRHGLQKQTETIRPGPSGHVDLFGGAAQQATRRVDFASPGPQQRSPSKRRDGPGQVAREWTGSGKYNRTGTIGKGAFAVVYKVTSKYDGRPYAAKELEKRRFVKNGVLDQKVENEMKIMKRVQHPNIVRYIENYDWDDRLLIIIMEFIPGGDLGKLILDEGPFPENMTQVMSRQLLSALGYLHVNNITHRDVKPDNILINTLQPLEVKLTDFGLSKMVDSEQTFLRTFCGTLLYCAPEVYTEYAEYDDNGIRNRGKRMRRLPGQRYNHAVDIWSLGGVLFYTLTGAPPYPVKSGISHSELLNRVMTTRLNTKPLQDQFVSQQGIDFIHLMLQRRPEIRATVDQLQAHPWLGGPGTTIVASQSYDEITDDDEDLLIEPSQYQRRDFVFEEDRVSDSMGEDDESEKENSALGHGSRAPRLFGEVGVSAIGSSGVIPAHYLNLPPGGNSMELTEILDSHADSPSGSESSLRANDHIHRHRQNTLSVNENQSADQLQSLVENVASQSLGESDPATKQKSPAYVSQFRSQSFDPKSSKRAIETSDEFDENTPPNKPTMKRLRSEGPTDDMPHDFLEETKLLAGIPQIKRLGSGRQSDRPVNKQAFWEQDRKTWHLNYPEMTQLQHDAFCQAAKQRGEDFWPGKTPLWDLAMKYFPPMPRSVEKDGPRRGLVVGLRRDDRKLADDVEFPPTAAPEDPDSIPDTLPPEAPTVTGFNFDTRGRVVAELTSSPDSYVKGIAIQIKDSLTTFGRGPENTEIFKPSSESRVPKSAFKIMLWKDGYDPARDPVKSPLPWQQDGLNDEDSYSFWISTKATVGIRVNGYLLGSVDSKNPSAPSQNWTRIYNEDALLIWGSPDTKIHTTLNFACTWGSSSKPRGADKRLELATPMLAEKLDNACYRTEKRIREVAEKNRKVDQSNTDCIMRQSTVEDERARSQQFQERIREALSYLNGKQQPFRKESYH